jgi:hypothetical protein
VPFADRKVRTVANYGEEQLIALSEIAAGGKKHWDVGEWEVCFRGIMKCDETVAQFAARKSNEDLL